MQTERLKANSCTETFLFVKGFIASVWGFIDFIVVYGFSKFSTKLILKTIRINFITITPKFVVNLFIKIGQSKL